MAKIWAAQWRGSYARTTHDAARFGEREWHLLAQRRARRWTRSRRSSHRQLARSLHRPLRYDARRLLSSLDCHWRRREEPSFAPFRAVVTRGRPAGLQGRRQPVLLNSAHRPIERALAAVVSGWRRQRCARCAKLGASWHRLIRRQIRLLLLRLLQRARIRRSRCSVTTLLLLCYCCLVVPLLPPEDSLSAQSAGRRLLVVPRRLVPAPRAAPRAALSSSGSFPAAS